MNKHKAFLCSILLMGVGYACQQSSDPYPQARSGVNSIYATFSDGSGFFNPENSAPYTGDTIKITVPAHYPIESNNVSDITQMRLGASLPGILSGADGIVDLTKPTPVTLRSENGSEKKYIVIAQVRKNSESQIKEFSLPSVNLTGFIAEQHQVIGLVAGSTNLQGLKPRLTLSAHATISPDTSLAQDFSKPVVYTVTAEDGTKTQYTIKPVSPQKVVSGIRKGSAKLLWTKTLGQLSINSTDHLTTSLAISGDHLLINTRNTANKYVDRFTGNLAGVQTMGGIHTRDFMNFYSTNDEAGHVLISNLITAVNQTLYIYKWDSATDAKPVEFIKWTSDITGAQAGRKFSITGDLNKDALIIMPASNSNNTILRWQVTGGVLKSQTPDKIRYGGTNKWTLAVDAISEGTSLTDNLYISGFPSDFVYMRTSDGAVLGQVPLAAAGYTTNHSLDLARFNNVNYLSAISVANLNGNAFLYNVSNPTALSTLPSNAAYNDVMVYKSPSLASAANGNLTGDVLMKVSNDGYKLIMYVLITNGSVAAYEFDCIDIDSIQ